MSVKITKRGPALEEPIIGGFQKEIGRQLPADYVSFLNDYNGGEPETNVFSISQLGDGGVVRFFGIRGSDRQGDLATERKRTARRVPARCLPIAEAEGGNLLCLSLGTDDYGTIYFWDHEEEAEEDEPPTDRNLYKVANSFQQFWDSLMKFDPSQVELKEGQVQEAWIDPDLLRQIKGDSRPL